MPGVFSVRADMSAIICPIGDSHHHYHHHHHQLWQQQQHAHSLSLVTRSHSAACRLEYAVPSLARWPTSRPPTGRRVPRAKMKGNAAYTSEVNWASWLLVAPLICAVRRPGQNLARGGRRRRRYCCLSECVYSPTVRKPNELLRLVVAMAQQQIRRALYHLRQGKRQQQLERLSGSQATRLPFSWALFIIEVAALPRPAGRAAGECHLASLHGACTHARSLGVHRIALLANLLGQPRLRKCADAHLLLAASARTIRTSVRALHVCVRLFVRARSRARVRAARERAFSPACGVVHGKTVSV